MRQHTISILAIPLIALMREKVRLPFPGFPQTRSFRLALALVIVITVVGSLAGPQSVGADFSEAEEILEGGTIGGVRGLRIRLIGANSPAFSKNANFVYYPASSIKVLEHFYAMTLIQAGTWSLNGTTAQVCTDINNCSVLLNNSAPGCMPIWQPMGAILSSMMKQSSNEATNTVQERIGTTFAPMQPPFIYQMPQLERFSIAYMGAPRYAHRYESLLS